MGDVMKHLRIVAAAAATLLLWGCLLSPGRFDATLDLRRDGSFTYRYAGEMVFVSPGSAMSEAVPDDDHFDAETQVCTDPAAGSDDAADPEPRDCTPEELEQKRKDHEEARAARVAKRKEDAEMARAMLGGIDPSDPKTMDEFARRLQGHAGWKSIRHKGNGVFDVQYELSGRLGHDFVFPVFPDIDMIIPFVKLVRVAGNRVRVIAPAFVQQPQDMSLRSMGAAFREPNGPGGGAPKKPEGTFTVTTDAEILTNNTREGPERSGTARTLKWIVGPLDAAKPEALLQL